MRDLNRMLATGWDPTAMSCLHENLPPKRIGKMGSTCHSWIIAVLALDRDERRRAAEIPLLIQVRLPSSAKRVEPGCARRELRDAQGAVRQSSRSNVQRTALLALVSEIKRDPLLQRLEQLVEGVAGGEASGQLRYVGPVAAVLNVDASS